jgi:hypothetical protein
MFMIYAAIIAWSALINVLLGDAFWKAFALLQAFWTFQLVQQFLQFRPTVTATKEAGADTPKSIADHELGRSAQLFPWLAVILGATSLVGFVIAVLVSGLTLISVVVLTASVYTGVLGFATGLAGLLAPYPRR